jgi:hypothetical protein
MKTQTRPLAASGSFINNLLGNNATEPKVGMLCTVCLYTDRHVYEVTEVAADGLSCTVRRMSTTRMDATGYGMTQDQSYQYSSNPGGHSMELVWKQRKGEDTGAWWVLYRTVDFTAAVKRAAKERNLFIYSQALTEEQRLAVYGDNNMPANVVKGITSERKRYSEISIIFDYADEHFDWSF